MVKYCPNCGKSSNDQAKFCENCGEKFENDNFNNKENEILNSLNPEDLLSAYVNEYRNFLDPFFDIYSSFMEDQSDTSFEMNQLNNHINSYLNRFFEAIETFVNYIDYYLNNFDVNNEDMFFYIGRSIGIKYDLDYMLFKSESIKDDISMIYKNDNGIDQVFNKLDMQFSNFKNKIENVLNLIQKVENKVIFIKNSNPPKNFNLNIECLILLSKLTNESSIINTKIIELIKLYNIPIIYWITFYKNVFEQNNLENANGSFFVYLGNNLFNEIDIYWISEYTELLINCINVIDKYDYDLIDNNIPDFWDTYFKCLNDTKNFLIDHKKYTKDFIEELKDYPQTTNNINLINTIQEYYDDIINLYKSTFSD